MACIGLYSGKRYSVLQLCRPIIYRISTTEFAKYREDGKFAISFWCPNAQNLSASGNFVPWPPPGALPSGLPLGAPPLDPRYRLALSRSPFVPPAVATWCWSWSSVLLNLNMGTWRYTGKSRKLCNLEKGCKILWMRQSCRTAMPTQTLILILTRNFIFLLWCILW